jgi:glycerophosphoryl diester phosphodiesterase
VAACAGHLIQSAERAPGIEPQPEQRRELRRVRERAVQRGGSNLALGAEEAPGDCRQRLPGGIADRPDHEERLAGSARLFGDRMALHVGRQRVGGRKKRPLLLRRDEQPLDARDRSDPRRDAGPGQCGEQPIAPGGIGREALALRQAHGIRDDQIAGPELRRETGRETEAQEPRRTFGEQPRGICPGSPRPRAAADDRHLEPAQAAGLGAQPGDHADHARAPGAGLWCARGKVASLHRLSTLEEKTTAMRLLASENGFVHVCGQRGHSSGAPENTLAALRAAKAAGATTAEIGVVLTRDDQIVLAHDLTLDRTTNGQGAIADRTAAEIAALDAGSWFGPEFAGEPMPSLPEAIEFAKAAGLGLVIEIRERARVERLTESLATMLEATGARDDALLISFDHVDLRRVKERIPRLLTEGITHCRHADPVAVARAARLDSLSVELARCHPDDARALHAAGIALRCHLPPPAELASLQRYGLDPLPPLREWLASGLIDALSGEDVGLVAALVASAPLR